MNEGQLVAALKSRDAGAVQELVDIYGDRLLRSAFSLCGNETEAQDIVQDTLLEAIRSVHRFQGRSTVYTWLHAILLNLTRRYHRERKRIVYDDEAADQEISPAEEGPGSADAGAAASAITEALQKMLSGAHREVIVPAPLRRHENPRDRRPTGRFKGTVKCKAALRDRRTAKTAAR